MQRPCHFCGQPLEESYRVCTQCGRPNSTPRQVRGGALFVSGMVVVLFF